METEVLKTTRTDLHQVDPRNVIVEEGFNKRFDYDDLASLALNILQFGLIEPLKGHKVRGAEQYILTDGHRRHAAVMLAIENHAKGVKGFEDISKIERIPMLPASANLKDRLFIMAITGTKKKLLNDMERLAVYDAIMEIGLAEGKKRPQIIDEIVTTMGVSKASVYNTLTIGKLPDVIKQRIIDNEISASTVVGITRELKTADQQIKAVEVAIESANKAAASTGKKVKATAKDVKGSANKPTMSRLEELVAKLDELGVKNQRVTTLKTLVDGLKNKKKLNQLLDYFM